MRLQLAQAFPALKPWAIGNEMTWPQIWLTVRHLKDEAVERERLRDEADKKHGTGRNSRSGSGSGTQRETRRYSVGIKRG